MTSDTASSEITRSTGVVPAAGASRLARLGGVVLCAALTAAAARVSVPLPGTTVPFTLQVVAVLLAGLLLGPRLGAAGQALYVGAGAAGLPVFAAGGGAAYLLGPTGGYLLAFPVAAAVAGGVAWSGRGVPRLVLAGLLALAVIHVGGAAWLAVAVGPTDAVRTGLLPFLVGDVLKLALAVLVAARLKEPARHLFGSG